MAGALERPWTACVGFLPLAEYVDARDADTILWLDIGTSLLSPDNTLYSQVETRIADQMAVLIRDYFRTLGLDKDEAEALHMHYYKEYGLAIRGLVKHHTIDPMDYDEKCDGALPLEEILHPDPALIALLRRIDRKKVRVYALTNAYKRLDTLVQGVVYCDYTITDFSCKPEREFYSAAEAAVGARSDAHHYFVDDSLNNVRTAHALGWQSCVYYDELHPSNEAYTQPDGIVTVSTMHQLPSVWPRVFS